MRMTIFKINYNSQYFFKMNAFIRQENHKTETKRLEREIIYLNNIQNLAHAFCVQMEKKTIFTIHFKNV